MGVIKNEKDKLVGAAKEKIGQLTKNETLKEEGIEQVSEAKVNELRQEKRIEELDDQSAELAAKEQDMTQSQTGRGELIDDETFEEPGEKQITSTQRRDEDQLKHYTGIEEKL